MGRKRGCFVNLWVVCVLSLYIGSKVGVCIEVYAQDYLYSGILAINSNGWKSYSCGVNYELSGPSGGILYENSPLHVIDTKINSKGNEVACCWSPVLAKTVYVSTKYIRKTEETSLLEEDEEFQYKFVESETFTELKKLIRELYSSSTYSNVHNLKSSIVNTNIKGVYGSITSLKEVVLAEGIEDIEREIYVAAYNNAPELSEVESLAVKLDTYLCVIAEGIDTYRDNLGNTSYWTKIFNPKIARVITDCDRLVEIINVVIAEDMYEKQVSNAKSDSRSNARIASTKVTELVMKDYNNNPRYIPGGSPYNKLSDRTRHWCVDYVQYMLTQEVMYCKSSLCGTVDALAKSVSDYGGIYYVTANERFKCGSVSTCESLKNSSYMKTIHMNFDYTADTMEVRPGDVIVYGRDGYGGEEDYRFAHVGIVVEVNEKGSFETIEGNTSYAGYDGQCLNQKNRSGLGWSSTVGNEKTGYVYYIAGVLRPNYQGTINGDSLK